MLRGSSFTDRLQRWLARSEFIDDPFALNEADQERSHLHNFFVDRPYLHDVLGDPSRPQAAFLMAGRGGGKTATREMVAYECQHARLRRRALAVRYNDFSLLLERVGGDLTQLSARHHVCVIVRLILKALTDDVPPTYFDLLGEMERSLLMGYAAAFADPISHLKLSKILSNEPVRLDWDTLTPLETMETLTELITQLGRIPEARYEALYVLVDRMDETAAGPEAAVPLLRPLVSQGPLLEMAHVAFKFFIPIQVGEQLRRVVTLRPDRLCIRTITWDQDALEQMVQQRLSYYSEGRKERLEELCTSAVKRSAMQRLVRACEGSPRTLLRLCKSLIHHHVSRSDDALIDGTDITETLYDFAHQLRAERTEPSQASLESLIPSSPSSPPDTGLYLDERGHVWVDGETLTPPLSELEFQLLKTLYRQAREIVSHEELIEAIWPGSDWTSMNEQNLRKLVARLRKRLEPESMGRKFRFIQNVRGRGYWLNVS